MKVPGLILGVAVASGAMVGAAGVSADEQRNRIMFNTCHSCHGTDGQSVGSMPSIAGKAPAYIAEALRDFRSGKKPSTVMARIAKGFSDAEIDALAKHFGKK